jgi:hypothetical protein
MFLVVIIEVKPRKIVLQIHIAGYRAQRKNARDCLFTIMIAEQANLKKGISAPTSEASGDIMWT